jgi:hypothetical protein
MQHLQELAAVLVDPAPTDPFDLAEPFQGPRRPPGQFHRLYVGHQHVVGQGLPAGRFPAPLEQAFVPGPFRFVEFGQQAQEGFPPGVVGIRGGSGLRGPGRFRCALAQAGFQVHAAAGTAFVGEEVGFGAEDFTVGQIPADRAVVEQARSRVEGDRQHPDLGHQGVHAVEKGGIAPPFIPPSPGLHAFTAPVRSAPLPEAGTPALRPGARYHVSLQAFK